MKNLLKIIILVFLLTNVSCKLSKLTEKEKLTSFFQKKEVTIVVTDSGLGGLSVAAELENQIKKSGVFNNVNIVFFNALAAKKHGYNSIKTTKEKVLVFNNALKAMDKKLHPDLLLIACNTLSVIYNETKFSKTVKIPVVGVVDAGVELISKNIKGTHNKAIILATKTTINQQTHKDKLIQLGIKNNQIITQACPRLAGRIERNPKSKKTKQLVEKFVDEVVEKLPKEHNNLYVSYNCTHYPYIDKLFQKEFKKRKVKIIDFLNPNPLMIDFIFDKKYINRYSKTNTKVKVISQVELSDKKVSAISKLIQSKSNKTAKALNNYILNPNYFKYTIY